MPRLINRNPTYSKHRASGQAVVSIQGRSVYLGPYGTKASRMEYDRVVAEWLANGRRLPRSAGGVGPDDITVTEVADRFWQHAQTYYRHADGTPTGEAEMFKAPMRFLRQFYGRSLARDFGPLALEAVRQKMIDAGWVRTSINKQAGRLRAVFRWAASKELIPGAVVENLKSMAPLKQGRTVAKEAERVRPVPDAVLDATIPHLSEVLAAMVSVQRLTGARPGEICAMRTCDIDRGAEVWTYRPETHKTLHHGYERTIQIGPRARTLLAPYIRPLNAQAHLFRPADAVAEMRQERAERRRTPEGIGNGPGTNRKRRPKRTAGNRYDVPAYRRAITRAADVANEWCKGGMVIANDERLIPRWHPHQLRHSSATEIRKRYGLEGAQVVLGHQSANITEIYAERDGEAARRIAAEIG